MIINKIYNQEDMQFIEKQFAIDSGSIQYSNDHGKTWNDVPSTDIGKWTKETLKDNKLVYWIFKRIR